MGVYDEYNIECDVRVDISVRACGQSVHDAAEEFYIFMAASYLFALAALLFFALYQCTSVFHKLRKRWQQHGLDRRLTVNPTIASTSAASTTSTSTATTTSTRRSLQPLHQQQLNQRRRRSRRHGSVSVQARLARQKRWRSLRPAFLLVVAFLLLSIVHAALVLAGTQQFVLQELFAVLPWCVIAEAALQLSRQWRHVVKDIRTMHNAFSSMQTTTISTTNSSPSQPSSPTAAAGGAGGAGGGRGDLSPRSTVASASASPRSPRTGGFVALSVLNVATFGQTNNSGSNNSPNNNSTTNNSSHPPLQFTNSLVSAGADGSVETESSVTDSRAVFFPQQTDNNSPSLSTQNHNNNNENNDNAHINNNDVDTKFNDAEEQPPNGLFGCADGICSRLSVVEVVLLLLLRSVILSTIVLSVLAGLARNSHRFAEQRRLVNAVCLLWAVGAAVMLYFFADSGVRLLRLISLHMPEGEKKVVLHRRMARLTVLLLVGCVFALVALVCYGAYASFVNTAAAAAAGWLVVYCGLLQFAVLCASFIVAAPMPTLSVYSETARRDSDAAYLTSMAQTQKKTPLMAAAAAVADLVVDGDSTSTNRTNPQHRGIAFTVSCDDIVSGGGGGGSGGGGGDMRNRLASMDGRNGDCLRPGNSSSSTSLASLGTVTADPSSGSSSSSDTSMSGSVASSVFFLPNGDAGGEMFPSSSALAAEDAPGPAPARLETDE